MNQQIVVIFSFLCLNACNSFHQAENPDASSAPAGMLTSVEAGVQDAALNNAIVQHSSCIDLPANCGPFGETDCCAQFSVPSGQYNRSNDPTYPATISSFSLDAYEITVGRFRRYVAAYTQTWNENLPSDKSSLISALKCSDKYQTWTDEVVEGNETRPINCITWFEAEAFCVWDGGRLATEAEWNYAAAGGDAQRLYPWGVVEPTTNIDLAVHGCFKNGTGTCTGVTNIATVGSVSAGNALWGHADMAGNLWEWVEDGYFSSYPSGTCTDCVYLSNTPFRVVRGGSFTIDQIGVLATSYRNGSNVPSFRSDTIGARCVRFP